MRLLQKGDLISLVSGTCNYGNSGLPGQVDVPLITTSINSSTDLTTATQLIQGQAGALANGIATTAARMNTPHQRQSGPVGHAAKRHEGVELLHRQPADTWRRVRDDKWN